MNIDRIRHLSLVETTKGGTLQLRALKLCEEAGELAAAVLKRTGAINASASSEDNVGEEAVDVMINCLDVLFTLGYEPDAIQALLDLKCNKWERKLRPSATRP